MSSKFINQVLELTNAERTKAGLNPLTLSNQLSQAAEGHSDSMANDDFFSHTGADGSSVSDRVQDTGYQYSRVGENIAVGQTTAEQVVQGWMDSPGHRANILNADYSEIGIGYEYLANDTGSVNYNHYWTQVFGTPLGNSNSGRGSNQTNPPVEQTNDSTAVEDNNNDVPPEVGNDSSAMDNLDLSTPDTSGSETVDTSNDSGLVSQVLELTNTERTKAGLNPLTLNNQLSQAAEGHSDSMANDDFFSHTGADGSSVSDRVQDTGYQYSRAGENIAAGQSTAEQVVQGWMDSPGHRANILNADYSEIGIGYEYLANDTGSVNYNHYWTQVFGTPLGNSNSGRGSNQTNPPVEQTNDSTAVEDNNNNDVPPEASNDSSAMDNLDLSTPDISGSETEANNADSTPVEESNSSLDNSDTNSMDSMDSANDDLTGTSGNSVMTGGDNSVNFPNDAESTNDYQLDFGDRSFADFSDLLSKLGKLGQGDISLDLNDYESLITQQMSNSDLSGEQKQLIQETMESLF